MTIKIAVTGSEGNVGRELLKMGAVPITSDILDREAISFEIGEISPDVIIHCAAATNVAWCEANSKQAFQINVRGVANIIDGFKGHFIYLSSDHIFNGKLKKGSYDEGVSPRPVNQYGATKWAGELVSSYGVSKSHIIRTSKILTYSMIEPELRRLIVDDETLEFSNVVYRSFMHVRHFVDSLYYYIDHIDKMPGVLNITGKESISYYGMWIELSNVFNIDQRKIKPRDFALPETEATPRPIHAGLDVSLAKKLGFPIYSSHQAAKALWDDFQEARTL